MKRKKPNKISMRLQGPRILVGIFLMLIMGIVGLLYAVTLNQQKSSQPSEILTTQTEGATPYPDSSQTASPMPEIVDEVKDGVYTNYTYGFSFEYDDEYFDHYAHLTQSNIIFTTSSGSKESRNSEKMNVNISQNNTSDYGQIGEIFGRMQFMSINESFEQNYTKYKKMNEYTVGNTKAVIFSVETIPTAETESFSGDYVVFEKNEVLISIVVSGFYANHERRVNLLNSLVESIKFM